METNFKITPNPTFNSLEVSFDGKPSEIVRDSLKAIKFRWHSVKKVWYGYGDEADVTATIENALKGIRTSAYGITAKKPTKTAKPAKVAKKVNKFGVEVGDVFYMNWGYDQTNVDFYQVIELVGEQSVRIAHVRPEIVKSENEGYMCGTYTYNITKEPMERDWGVHIKNKDKGDVKRVLQCGDSLYLNMSSYANAYKIPFGLRSEYVSWYA